MSMSLPGPWIDYEAKEAAPWTSNNGIVKFIEFPVRIPAMSHRAFHLYWQRHHSPSVMNVTAFSQFMRKYNTGHVYPDKVVGLPSHYLQSTPFEGASEVWINGLSEVSGWLGQSLYAELIQPDEPRFIRQDGTVEIVVCKEESVHESQIDMVENGLTKLYVLVKRRAGLDHDGFHATLSAHAKLIMQQPSLRSMLRKLVVSHRLREPWPAGMVLADIDAVVEFWFDHRHQIAEFFADPAYSSKIAAREGSLVDAANIRALVAKVHVVHDEFSFQPSTTQPLSFTWND